MRMADDPELTERVRRALSGVEGVQERRMFGSVGFLVDGTLRIAVGTHPDHVAMVRVGDAGADVVDRPGVGPAVMRGRPMSGWLFLQREAIDSEEDVARWVAVGMSAVQQVR